MKPQFETQMKFGMNVQELAEALGISNATAFRLSHQPGFPIIKVGKRRIIPVPLLMKWLEEQAQQQEV